MAGVEWGPKDLPKNNRDLREVIRFKGSQVAEIATSIKSYLQKNPGTTQDQAISDLYPKQLLERTHLALTVHNQLSVLGRNGNDVYTVIVRADQKSVISREPGEKQSRAGEGSPHYYYEIDWINEPIQKADYPFKTAAQREAEKLAQDKERAAYYRTRAEAYRQHEQEAKIEEMIIDHIRESGEQAIKSGEVKLKLGPNQTAIIMCRDLYRENDDGTPRYIPINRKTGQIMADITSYYWGRELHTDALRYLEAQAQKLEGKDAEYVPAPPDPGICQKIYDLAIKLGILKIEGTPQTGIGFFYVPNHFQTDQYINLEQGVVETNDSRYPDRPLNPHFAEFLKQKKAEKNNTNQRMVL